MPPASTNMLWESEKEFWRAKLFLSYYVEVLFSSPTAHLITNQDNPIMLINRKIIGAMKTMNEFAPTSFI